MENNRKDLIEENDNLEEKAELTEENVEESAEKIQSEDGENTETKEEESSSEGDAEKVNIEENASGCDPSEDSDGDLFDVEEPESDDTVEEKPKKKKRSVFDIIRTVLIFLFIAVFIVSAKEIKQY